MTANIDTMFSYKETPWHGEGTIVQDELTSAGAIEAAGLDWSVDTKRIYTGTGIPLNEYRAVIRSDNEAVLGVVGTRFVPLQNRRAFEFFDDLVKGGKAKYETAGALRGGKKIWILARLNSSFEVFKGDEIRKYALLAHAHDGSLSANLLFTPKRVVCENTLNAALRGRSGSDGVSIRHTTNMESRLEDAAIQMRLIEQSYEHIQLRLDRLANIKMDTNAVKDFYDRMFGDEGAGGVKRQALTSLFEGGVGSNYGRGTAYAMFNAVTEYTDHMVSTRGKSSERLDSILFGPRFRMKSKAMNLLLN